MRLREAVFAEAEDLLEDLPRERLGEAVGEHAVDEAALERLHAALALPGGHRTAQLVGLARRETRGDDGELHHLFLEDRHAEGALQHLLDRRARVGHRLLAVAAAQVRMHHLALDRTRPHDRHLDDEIVVIARPQARQHRHLGPRFDLEHAGRVGTADHRVDLRVLGRHAGEVQRARQCLAAVVAVDEVKRAADRGQHPEAEHIDLQEPERIQVILVPLDHGALRHRCVLDRHQLVEPVAGDHEATHVLRQVAREALHLRRERDQAREARVLRIEAAGTHALRVDAPAVPPLHALREPVEPVGGQAEGLADVAQRTARPVGDQRRGERRALAAVLAVDVLDDLLAPLMLEVHVDVRRLVALAGDEALEQHRHARGIHRGDLQAVTDHRIGRRAAALAQDPLAAREVHDVVHRQEERFIREFRDQRELMLDGGAHCRRHAVGPALAGTRFGQRPQVARRRGARRHDLLRVLIAQLLEREAAARGDLQRRGQQRRGIQLAEPGERPQATLAVRVQREPGLADSRVQADRGQQVLECAAAAPVHVDIAGGDAGHLEFGAERRELGEATRVTAAGQQFHADPQAPGEALAQPRTLRRTQAGDCGGSCRGQPDDEALRERAVEVGGLQRVTALGCGAPRLADQAAQGAVAGARGRERDELQAVGEAQLAADQQCEAVFFRGDMGADDAGERAFVSQRERLVAEPRGLRNELLRLRGAAQERETAQ